jgi:hypothetical protein
VRNRFVAAEAAPISLMPTAFWVTVVAICMVKPRPTPSRAM